MKQEGCLGISFRGGMDGACKNRNKTKRNGGGKEIKNKPRFKKSEMHGDLPFGYCGECISAEEGRNINTQNKGGEKT